MNEMQIFENPAFGQVRTVAIEGEPWFVGKDVAEILGYKNPSEALIERVDEEDKLNSKTLSSFELNLGQRGGWLINESGLYSLVLSSKLPTAKAFKRWITSEVLPSIRKTGRYEIQHEELSTRPLTSDDYIEAAKTVAKCDNRRLPIVIDLFRKAGLDISVLLPVQQEQNIESEFIVDLLNQYSLPELCKKLNINKSSLYYYRIGKYKPRKERQKMIIEVLTEGR